MRDDDRLNDTTKNQVPYPKNTRLAAILVVVALVLAALIYFLYRAATNGNV